MISQAGLLAFLNKTMQNFGIRRDLVFLTDQAHYLRVLGCKKGSKSLDSIAQLTIRRIQTSYAVLLVFHILFQEMDLRGEITGVTHRRLSWWIPILVRVWLPRVFRDWAIKTLSNEMGAMLGWVVFFGTIQNKANAALLARIRLFEVVCPMHKLPLKDINSLKSNHTMRCVKVTRSQW